MIDRDTVVRLAKEAAIDGDHFDFDTAWGIRFATLIANETLERAAKVCDENVSGNYKIDDLCNEVPWEAEVIGEIRASTDLAIAIRALKE